MKKLIYIIILLAFVSCEDVLEKNDLTAINETDVWSDYTLARAFMDNIALSGPSWPADYSKYCDEAGSYTNTAVIYGLIDVDNLGGLAYWPYATIRKINILIENLETSSIEDEYKDLLYGQAHFWRAYHYFEMVKRFGGVPIIKEAQGPDDDLLVSRNSTSECFSFIEDELESAIQLLPEKFTGAEAGKINRAVAYAYKARVLQYKASPQFNPSGNSALWEAAYTANKEAYDWLTAQGYGLYDDFGDLWFDEMNEEVIFATRYNNPERTTTRPKRARPYSQSTGAVWVDMPTQELVDAFPMKDGKSIEGHSSYDAEKYWENRDPRFLETVIYNGAAWELSGEAGRLQYTYEGEPEDGYGSSFGTETGYYTPKAVELAPDLATATYGSVDWVEIRFAEVMMNYAETANETGHTEVAYDILKQIRMRAGIESGTDEMYGLEAGMGKEEMREALMFERFIEFTFEGKRFWDLRRWRWLDRLNGTVRHGLISRPVDQNDLSKGFTLHDLVLDTEQAINYTENYYFLPILSSELETNPNLLQTDGWGDGGFDPLQ